jgi:hypothetical protein
MENNSPTIKVNISKTLGIEENIMLGVSYSLEEVDSYEEFFQEFWYIFDWLYSKMPGLDLAIVEHRIDTWPYATPIC